MARVKEAVIDASVVARWYVEEEWSDIALKVRSDYEKGLVDLIAPYLLIYEVSNSLRYSPDVNMNDVSDSIKSLLHMQLDFRHLTIEEVESLTMLAFKFNISMYDAVYLAIAQSLGISFLTGDSKLHKKVGSKSAILLPDYDYSRL
jgi:predicted nucleic acid-binding protein